MHILLAAATTFEIQPTIDFLGQIPRPSPVHLTQPGVGTPPHSAPSHHIDTLITGIGSLSTSWSLMRQIGSQRPDLIIQAGIAGCFPGRILPGKVVAIKEELLGDLGVWEEQRWKTLFDLKLTDKDAPPFSDGLLVNPYKRLLALTGLETVQAMTVNEITTDPEKIGWHQQNTPDVVVESMEGGSLHYTCLREEIAFLQLRSISNEIGIRDKTKWDIKGAIDRLNKELISLLEKLATTDKTIIELY